MPGARAYAGGVAISGEDDGAAARLPEELDAWVIARALPHPHGEWEASYEFLRGKLAGWVDEHRHQGAQGEEPPRRPSEDV